MFKGCFTALITPFADGRVDEESYRALVDWQVKQGVHGLVPCGTTGESPTLTPEEHCRVIKLCLEVVDGRVPVLAGTGSNSTREAITFTRHAQEAGATGALLVVPYYNKPGQEALYQHFKAIHDATDLPLVIYNIPGRSVVDVTVETMARLATLPRVVGVKDASNDLARPALTRLACGPDFCQLSGEDGTLAAFLAQGGHGVISVTSNVAPALVAEQINAWEAGDVARVAALRDQLMPLHRALFLEASPAPVKAAMHRLGHCRNELRLPLIPVSAATEEQIDKALAHAGLAP